MLAHFHYCNKGSHPFTDDWVRSGDTSLTRLDSEQLQFLRETVEQTNNRSKLYTTRPSFVHPGTDDWQIRRPL